MCHVIRRLRQLEDGKKLKRYLFMADTHGNIEYWRRNYNCCLLNSSIDDLACKELRKVILLVHCLWLGFGDAIKDIMF